ncbi:MAG: lipoyl synthase [Chlamydiales bacterium]
MQKPRKLNVLPENPEEKNPSKAVGPGRFPPWLRRKLPKGNALWQTQRIVGKHRLSTVCEEAKCPNLMSCWSQKTATFLAMGHQCTRSCGFCSIDFAAQPKVLDENEPKHLAESVKQLELKHAVITMVARDDLSDGGAAHMSKIIQEVRRQNPGTTIEVLTSDFEGNEDALHTIVEAKPEIFNHNIETVRSLTPRVRHRASYDRTLSVLRYVSQHQSNTYLKSGLMVGLGETDEEVKETIRDLFEAGCQLITIGHYLQSSPRKLRVKAFITPEQFEEYAAYGRSIGVLDVYSGPFVRSSYNAASLFKALLEKKIHD